MSSNALQLLSAYRIVKLIVTPWKEWDAYSLGLIDEKGKKIKEAETREEKDAMPILNVLAMNLKRVISKIPGGSSKLGSMTAALFLLKEELHLDEESVEHIVEKLGIGDELYADAPNQITEQTNTMVVDDKVIRNITDTDERFYGRKIFEGKDVLSGKKVRFLGD